MSKIADNVSIVNAMTIPGPMLDQPVYRCDRWPMQNAYIAERAAGRSSYATALWSDASSSKQTGDKEISAGIIYRSS